MGEKLATPLRRCRCLRLGVRNPSSGGESIDQQEEMLQLLERHRGALRLPRCEVESLMDGNALDEVPGISRGHIDQAEGRAVCRHLNIEVPAASSAATKASRTASVGIQAVNLERRAGAGGVAASRGVGRGDDVRRDPGGI